ncbi:MAG: hypothetical protein AB7I48_00215, partial [Planctomycetaceae bacterium]
LLGGDAIEYGAIGNTFFGFFYWILAIAVMVIVPFGAYRSLLTEKDQATFDLLSITTLTPRQIVWGKLLSALVQVLIFYSAIAPFIAFTSLLQGFELVAVTFRLIATLLLSMLVSMVAIASSAMTKQRQWQGLTSLVMLFLLFFAMTSLLGPIEFVVAQLDLLAAETWWVLGLSLLIGASYFLLFQKVAAAHLTFESDDRTSGIRLVCSGQFFLLWLGLFALDWLGPSSFAVDQDLVIAATFGSFVHWTIVGLVAVTENPYLSRRIRRNLPARTVLRLLLAPFLQGGHRGYLYVLLHLTALVAVSTWAISQLGGSMSRDLDVPLAIACYLMIYLGLGCALGRWCLGLSGDIRPGHIRVLTLMILAIGCLGPLVPMLWRADFRFEYNLWMLPNPYATVVHLLDNSGGTTAILSILATTAILAALANLRAMKRGVAEVIFADVKLQPSPNAAVQTLSKSD